MTAVTSPPLPSTTSATTASTTSATTAATTSPTPPARVARDRIALRRSRSVISWSAWLTIALVAAAFGAAFASGTARATAGDIGMGDGAALVVVALTSILAFLALSLGFGQSRSPGRTPQDRSDQVEPPRPVLAPSTVVPAGVKILPASSYADVDVAIVMESTYPYLKGGVSAVVHDIVMGNQDLTFGIIHITWDSSSPHEDLYGMPANVSWVRPVYLSMAEHHADFVSLRPSDLNMSGPERRALATRLFDAIAAVLAGDMDPMWALYDDGMNPRTRTFPLWAVLGSKEFMVAARDRLPGLGIPLTEMFWLLREFFSLACAVLGGDIPRAGVYHAHTTGYASLIGAAAARQNGTKFLLTEHNLYVRDTVNTRLGRSMALRLTARDWREFDVPPLDRAWMAWWTEIGQFCYPSAETVTYLYPGAISEAADLGAPIERSVVIPNGMIVREFEDVAAQRELVRQRIQTDPDHTWRLVYIARVVPIKGLADLISSLALLIDRGITNFHLDVLGPTEHTPDYYRMCREKARTLRIEDYLTFRGTVQVREMLGDYDLLVLSSYNEGQPIVVLEAMAAGIPTVGTEVGGMAQLIGDPLTTPGGRTWGASGLLVQAGDEVEMADALQTMMRAPDMYERFAENARGRLAGFFQLEDAMGAYNRLYRELGGLPIEPLEVDPSSVEPLATATRVTAPLVTAPLVTGSFAERHPAEDHTGLESSGFPDLDDLIFGDGRRSRR